MRHWYTRYRISNALDAGDPASVMRHGHASRCASCQAFATSLQAQHAALTGGARAAPRPVVVAAPSRVRRPLLLAAPLALAAAAALAWSLGSLGSLGSSGSSNSGGTATGSDSTATIKTVAIAPSEAPTLHVRDVASSVSQLFGDRTPLDTELHDLIHDGRRGLHAVLAMGGLQ